MESVWAYVRDYYQNPDVEADFARLAEYCPGVVAGYIALRKEAFRSDGALSDKTRELVIVGIECMARKSNPPPIGHARRAVEEGATVQEVAEVVSLAIMIGGMITYRESGRFALEEAEKRALELQSLTDG